MRGAAVLVVCVVLMQGMLVIAGEDSGHTGMSQEERLQYHSSWEVSGSGKALTSDAIRAIPSVQSTSPASFTQGPMNSSWPMLSHDSVHSGRNQYSTANNSGTELWQVHGDEGGEVWSSAVIDTNGNIYFGTMGADGALYALYPNGTIKWRHPINGIIWCTPALSEDGTIYFTVWGGDPYLHAINSNGTLKWLLPVEGSCACSPSISSDGTIYFGGDDYNIYAASPNGTEKWQYLTGYIVMASPAIGNDGTVYIGSGDQYLYALNPNGTLRWKYLTGGEIKGTASIAPDGTIYIPSFDGYFYALNPNGSMKWRASTGDNITAAGFALAQDGTIYIGTERLRAYFPNGTLKWSTDVQGDVYGTVPAVSADGTIYVTAGNSLVAVNPDGTIKWRSSLSDEQSHSSPCIGPNDRVYVGSFYRDYGYLHAFGPGVPKKIEILQPQSGHLYINDHRLGPALFKNTIILGSVTFKVNVYSPGDLINVTFYIADFHKSVTSPPFEWKMNQWYGKYLIQGTVSVIAYYKGGPTWAEYVPVIYFHIY